MKTFYYLVGLLLFVASCQGVDGECESPRFSPNEISLNNTDTTIVIKSSNNLEWNFCCFMSNGMELGIYENENGDTQDKFHGQDVVEEGWFRVEKIDSKTIRITLQKTTEERDLSFLLFRGNCLQEISITQQATPVETNQ